MHQILELDIHYLQTKCINIEKKTPQLYLRVYLQIIYAFFLVVNYILLFSLLLIPGIVVIVLAV